VENRVGIQQVVPNRVVGASVAGHSAALLSLAVLCICSDALARSPGDVFDHFAGTPQLVVTKVAHAEWRKSPDAEITCVEQDLRPRGIEHSASDRAGIPSSDGRVAPGHAPCRNQMRQPVLLTRLTSAQTDPYNVDGLTLGSKVAYGTLAYQHYQCGPSQKFEGFVWCTKPISDKEARGRFKAWFSILHAQDGGIAYVNRYQEPAYWDANEVADDIQRYSRKIGEEPHVIQLPARPGLPKGTLATWGKVVLEPIVGDELRLLAGDKPLKKGIAIDFIGNFTRSARQGLPIYRLTGGAGFVWVASYDESGRGTLRFSAVDASTYSPQSLPPPAITPAPVSADPVGGAATAVEAQPTSPPGMASLPPVDVAAARPYLGENSDCSAAPGCGTPTLTLSSVAAPPLDPNDVTSQVLNDSTMRLQRIHPAGGAENAPESSASNFRTNEPEHGILTLFSANWVWIISILIASGPAGYWSTRPPVARGRGVQSWQGWAALAVAIGLVVAILLPVQAGLYLGALLFLSFLCIKGYLAGAWLRRVRTRTQVAAAGTAEDARGATEVRTADEATRAGQAKAAEDTPSAAEVKAAEDARRAAGVKAAEASAAEDSLCAEVKATEDARRVAEVKAAEDTPSGAEVKAAGNTPSGAEVNATKDARRASEVKAAKDTPCAAEGRASRKRAASQKSKPPRMRAAPPRRKSEGRRGRTSTASVIMPP
jgi:hypothetical protein